jgi:hypothetical protein
MNKRSSGVKAWIIYWEVHPGHPLPVAHDNEVVAVLSAIWGNEKVKDILERLHLERTMTPAELLSWRGRASSPYPPQVGANRHGIPVEGLEYWCGHNPMLVARKVEQLMAIDEFELQWKQVGIRHYSFSCEAAGVRSCPLAGKDPPILEKRWRRPGYGSTWATLEARS